MGECCLHRTRVCRWARESASRKESEVVDIHCFCLHLHVFRSFGL